MDGVAVALVPVRERGRRVSLLQDALRKAQRLGGSLSAAPSASPRGIARDAGNAVEDDRRDPCRGVRGGRRGGALPHAPHRSSARHSPGPCGIAGDPPACVPGDASAVSRRPGAARGIGRRTSGGGGFRTRFDPADGEGGLLPCPPPGEDGAASRFRVVRSGGGRVPATAGAAPLPVPGERIDPVLEKFNAGVAALEPRGRGRGGAAAPGGHRVVAGSRGGVERPRPRAAPAEAAGRGGRRFLEGSLPLSQVCPRAAQRGAAPAGAGADRGGGRASSPGRRIFPPERSLPA